MPGFRGAIDGTGRFEYVPIPEREPTREEVPTYGDLGLVMTDVDDVAERPVHLDPEFADYPHCERYTYGDEHGVKAAPIRELDVGDYLFFYATLATAGTATRDRICDDWGAYLIGQFRLATGPIAPPSRDGVPPDLTSNAHVKRREFDAEVLVRGDPEGSRLYGRAVPLSRGDDGSAPNRLVTRWSSDSGEGPWWRRPLRFDGEGVSTVLDEVKSETDDASTSVT